MILGRLKSSVRLLFMMSEFPAYDPDAAYGAPSERPELARRTNFADVETMQRADPYEVAAVVLRAVFDPLVGSITEGRADPDRLLSGAETCIRNFSRGLFATLSGGYPAGFLEIVARCTAIWRNALVAETLQLASGPQVILIEPAVLGQTDDALIARLRTRP